MTSSTHLPHALSRFVDIYKPLYFFGSFLAHRCLYSPLPSFLSTLTQCNRLPTQKLLSFRCFTSFIIVSYFILVLCCYEICCGSIHRESNYRVLFTVWLRQALFSPGISFSIQTCSRSIIAPTSSHFMHHSDSRLNSSVNRLAYLFVHRLHSFSTTHLAASLPAYGLHGR